MCVLDSQSFFGGFQNLSYPLLGNICDCKINHLFYVVCDKVFLSRFEDIVYLTRSSSPSPPQFLFFPLQLLFPPTPLHPSQILNQLLQVLHVLQYICQTFDPVHIIQAVAFKGQTEVVIWKSETRCSRRG